MPALPPARQALPGTVALPPRKVFGLFFLVAPELIILSTLLIVQRPPPCNVCSFSQPTHPSTLPNIHVCQVATDFRAFSELLLPHARTANGLANPSKRKTCPCNRHSFPLGYLCAAVLLQGFRLRLDRGGVVSTGLSEAHSPGPRPPVLRVCVKPDGVETLLRHVKRSSARVNRNKTKKKKTKKAAQV